MEKVFPEGYPENLLQLIIEDGAKENTIKDVYRVSFLGENNRDAFLSSFMERGQNQNGYEIRDFALAETENLDIGLYSTSLFDSEKTSFKILKMFKKHYNGPKLLYGIINPYFGYSIKTNESRSCRHADKHHIDWWLYKNADPSVDFKIIEEKE